MKLGKLLFVFSLLVSIWACNNSDDGFEVIPPRLLAEVEIENDAEIREYLSTHFYNYEEFQNPPVGFDFKIVVDTIAGENADRIPMIDQAQSATVSVSSVEFALEETTTVDHTYYYIVAREGIGESITVADSSLVRYEGSLINGLVFDGSENIPIWFDLARIQAPLQGFRGFSEAMVNFRAGGEFQTNPDGTFTVDGFGVGMMIFPSGLGSFNGSQAGIPQYSPIIFTVDLFTVNRTDHDGDGIPSIMEDVNGDGFLFNDNTDEEAETDNFILATADFQDPDDDEDGTPTREEIIINADGTITFPDGDGDGIPDYRDPDTN